MIIFLLLSNFLLSYGTSPPHPTFALFFNKLQLKLPCIQPKFFPSYLNLLPRHPDAPKILSPDSNLDYLLSYMPETSVSLTRTGSLTIKLILTYIKFIFVFSVPNRVNDQKPFAK